MSAGEADAPDLPERVLREMVAALPPEKRPRALRRLVYEVYRMHEEMGVEVPGWLRRMRGKGSA